MNASRRTGLVFFPAFDWAISPDHPEREERLLYTQDQVFEEGIMDIEGLTELKPRLASPDDVQRVHFCVPDIEHSVTESHLISAGGCLVVADALMKGEVDCGFALVRPPGHHAMKVVHGSRGFCTINVEAVMVEYLRHQYGVDRIAIVDTDCHHGDGTQDIYWHDPNTLFISLHQDGRTLYPGSGFPEEMGGPNALGTTVNVPLPPGTSAEGFLYVLERIVLPVIEEFEPELIVNSAGQDNHYSDPITNMNFSAQGYAALTERLQPHIAVLEGGYSIEGALPYVNVGIILALAGMDYSRVREPDYDPDRIKQSEMVTAAIRQTCDQILELRKSLPAKREKYVKGSQYVERTRKIFYDTDGFFEGQKETVRICQECAGLVSIDSWADSGRRILAVHVPRGGCEVCRATANRWFDNASTRRFDLVCLQDRVAGTYQVKRA
ncbi:MAG: histone deacetylase [Deltaproteobacteria bacterium]|nr:histone deacetylase [Deltaproteobacteria bacterium]MBW2072268.1 histone deacetylase [Deltaproteobacteria bacterium]